MIYFKKLGEMGRLGNQMFQYAALRGLCLLNGYRAVISNLSAKSCHGQSGLLNEFNIKADIYKGELSYGRYKEPSWRRVDENFFDLKDNRTIEGYFQSIFYFQHRKETIKQELTPKHHHLEAAMVKINGIREMYNAEVVSVHLRRGDNLTEPRSIPNYGKVYEDNGVFFRYLLKAKNVFLGRKVKFLVFTGGARGKEDNTPDMDWCRKNLIGDEYVFLDGEDPVSDFSRIMLCDHNILSHISSFGWWAAYLNRNPNRITVAPEYYHPEEPTLKRHMFYPKGYILI